MEPEVKDDVTKKVKDIDHNDKANLYLQHGIDEYKKENWQEAIVAWSYALNTTPIGDLGRHIILRRLRSRAHHHVKFHISALDDIENVLLWSNILTSTKSAIRVPVRTPSSLRRPLPFSHAHPPPRIGSTRQRHCDVL